MKLFKYLLILFAFSLFAKEKVQVVPRKPTNQSENVKIYIVYPENGQIDFQNRDIWMQIRLRGYPLGNKTIASERANEIVNSKLGQSVHVFIDNQPYFAKIGPSLAPFDEEGNYFESMYKFEIPFVLSEGMHFIRVFPCRSYGESLKEEGCFAASFFYVKKKKINNFQDLKKPYITYNEPSGYMRLTENEPILLDFYVTNCELSKDGYQVVLTIDDKIKRTLTAWLPYYIIGLKKGKHQIRLQLVDKDLKQIPGFFNDTLREFTIY